MLNIPQNRTAPAKLILVGVSIVLGFTILGIWAMAFSDRAKVNDALLLAARVRPVQFTTDDALAARARLEKLAHPAGAAAGQPEVQKTNESKDGKNNREGREGQPAREGQGGNRGPLSEEFASLLEKHPLFGAAPKSGPPQANVQGILGDTALINGEWLKVGSESKGIKLVATLPDKVIVEIEGKQQEASVWQNMPDKPMPPSPPSMMGPGGSMGGSLSPRERAMMLKMERKLGGSSASFREALRARSQRDLGGANRDFSRPSERRSEMERRAESGGKQALGLMPPGANGSLGEKIGKKSKIGKFPGSGNMSFDGPMSGDSPNGVKASKKMKNFDGGMTPGGMGGPSGKPPKGPKSMRSPGFSGGMPGGSKPGSGSAGSGMSGSGMPGEKPIKKRRDGLSPSGGPSSDPSRMKNSSSSDPSRGDRGSRLRKARDIYRNGSGQSGQ